MHLISIIYFFRNVCKVINSYVEIKQLQTGTTTEMLIRSFSSFWTLWSIIVQLSPPVELARVNGVSEQDQTEESQLFSVYISTTPSEEEVETRKITIGRTPTENDVQFLLFNPTQNEEKWTKLDLDTLAISDLKKEKPFKIAIHGFLSGCNKTDFPEDIFRAYLELSSDYNLICLDWSSLANPVVEAMSILHYPKAVEFTLFVGETLAQFIEELMKTGYVSQDASNIHIIGHSLGCHIAGVGGHHFYDRQTKKIGRITGLDPAGPLFYLKSGDQKAKLGKSDAQFVDVIYTNVGQLGVAFNDVNLGHANFLPNGGAKQPFCSNILKNADEILGSCSHSSAKGMFLKSIKRKIIACPCKTWRNFKAKRSKCKSSKVALFGEKASARKRGKYCLNVRSIK